MHIMSREDTLSHRQRRQHSAAFKSELVARALQPGASVSAIALENGLNTNLLFAWRRQHLRAIARQQAAPVLLPVQIAPVEPDSRAAAKAAKPQTTSGTIEIEVGGACVRVRGAVDEASLRCVIGMLREPRA